MPADPVTSAVRGPEHPGVLPGALLAQLMTPGGGTAGHVRRSARDLVADVLCIMVAIGITVLVFVLPPGPGGLGLPGAPPMVNLGAGVLTWMLLWWRRRWPVALAVGLVTVAVAVPTVAGAALIAVFTAAVHERSAVTAAVTGYAAAAALVQHWLHPIDPATPGTYWTAVGVHVLLAAMAATWGVTVRARRQLVLSLAERTRRAEAEQQLRVEQARQRERERIAREMHDVLAHRLSLLSMHAGALEFRPDATPETVAETAGVIRASAHQSLTDLREIISVLRASDADADALHPQPALDELAVLVVETRRAGTTVTMHEDLAADTAPPLLGRTAYRIVQEGLTNARKHAPGEPVTVGVTGGPGRGLTIELRNRIAAGAGPPVPGSGTGLVGLAERAELAGGRIEHGVSGDGKFRLSAWLPWPA
jgi:signal transduction histidine kinase